MIISKEKKFTHEGVVIEALPSLMFKVKLDNGNEILAKLAGKMRLHHIRVLIGDHVRVEMTPSDNTKGRITFRGK